MRRHTNPVRNSTVGDEAALRKFRRERLVGRYIANPAIALLGRIGVRTSFAAELETLGRRSGRPRRVPVSARFDETGAWVISQHGRRSGWALNVVDNPAVRIRQGDHWCTGTAHFVPDDDPSARARTFATHSALAPIVAATFRALASDPISVRIDFEPRGDQ